MATDTPRSNRFVYQPADRIEVIPEGDASRLQELGIVPVDGGGSAEPKTPTPPSKTVR